MQGLDLTLFIFTRYYLAVFFTFVATFYTVRIIWLQLKLNKQMIHPGKTFCATWWNHLLFRIFRAGIWIVCLTRVFYPQLDGYLGMFTSFNHAGIIMSGLILLTFGFGFTLYIHLKMKNLWRSGIDPNSPHQLLTDGVYAKSRNPMYIGVITAQLGFFLALPSVFTFICLLIGITAIYRQTLSEEHALAAKFQTTYLQYCRNVPRWW
ncbi:methyltransferase family protein [Thalassotalea ganghwensis]